MFWSVCQYSAWSHLSFTVGLSSVWCLDFQSCFLPHESLRVWLIIMFFQGWGHTPLANIWLVLEEASCWGPTAPKELPSWSPLVTREGELHQLWKDSHLQFPTHWLKTYYWCESAAFHAQWLDVCSFHEFLPTLAGIVTLSRPIPLSSSFFPSLSLYLSPTLDLLLWPFWNTGWIKSICQYLSLTVGLTLRISIM